MILHDGLIDRDEVEDANEITPCVGSAGVQAIIMDIMISLPVSPTPESRKV